MAFVQTLPWQCEVTVSCNRCDVCLSSSNESDVAYGLEEVHDVGTFVQISELHDIGDRMRMVVQGHRRWVGVAECSGLF